MLSTTTCRFWQRRSTLLPDKTSLFRKTFLTTLQLVELPLQGKQTMRIVGFMLQQ